MLVDFERSEDAAGTGVPLDADGDVVREASVNVTERMVRDAMAASVGEMLQRPPAYSAVKVGGRKLSRQGGAGSRRGGRGARHMSIVQVACIHGNSARGRCARCTYGRREGVELPRFRGRSISSRGGPRTVPPFELGG